MSNVSIDSATGNLLIGGKPVFAIGLSDPPPVGSMTPGGLDAWTEIADAGVNFGRSYPSWPSFSNTSAVDEEILSQGEILDAAVGHGLQVWMGLGAVANDLSQEPLLERIVNAFKDHPGLGAWKGSDEPAHGQVAAAGCVAAYERLRALDPNHPVVIIEAPRGPAPTPGGTNDTRLTAAAVKPYAAACDIHGVDIYPIPAGVHAGKAPVNTDISVVGDMTAIIASATQRKAIWTTLQIAWSGVEPSKGNKLVFPTLVQARFMAYDAIVTGARGLLFFGGHITDTLSGADRTAGWNWTYWKNVQRPLVVELTDADHTAALVAPLAPFVIKANAPDIALSAREAGGFVYLIAVRRSATATGPARVQFTGLPKGITDGTVLGHQGVSNPPRPFSVETGAFTDLAAFAPHNARVYKFPL
jgi:hypothetical protein